MYCERTSFYPVTPACEILTPNQRPSTGDSACKTNVLCFFSGCYAATESDLFFHGVGQHVGEVTTKCIKSVMLSALTSAKAKNVVGVPGGCGPTEGVAGAGSDVRVP